MRKWKNSNRINSDRVPFFENVVSLYTLVEILWCQYRSYNIDCHGGGGWIRRSRLLVYKI